MAAIAAVAPIRKKRPSPLCACVDFSLALVVVILASVMRKVKRKRKKLKRPLDILYEQRCPARRLVCSPLPAGSGGHNESPIEGCAVFKRFVSAGSANSKALLFCSVLFVELSLVYSGHPKWITWPLAS